MRLLFQGDSITDAGRDYGDPRNLGNGYARLAADRLRENHPSVEWEFYNLGISGHRTGDLKARWQSDCLDYKPDILSILIGINDVWRAFDAGDPTSAADFEDNYRYLLESVKKETDAKILLLEPFLLINAPDREEWLDDISRKIAATRRLAREFADAYIPLDGLFAAASVQKPPAAWAGDGVHPSDEGNELIARYYAEAVASLI